MLTSIHTPGAFIISHTLPSGEIVSFEENKILAVDTNFFKKFNFPSTEGDNMTALLQANTMVMTESTDKKYFGEDNPIGRLLS